MNIVALLLTIVLSIFSTGVMSYIAMATPIGPWIAPTLVLVGSILLRMILYRKSETTLMLATAGGSLGGIIATACGFSFPTLYFLDPTLFNSWVADPLYFAGIVTWLTLAAGGFGFIIADIIEEKLLVQQQMAFPIGQLVYKMIAVQNQARKAFELMIGFVSTIIFGLLQTGFWRIPSIIPKTITLLPAFSWRFIAIPTLYVRFDTLPMLLAIGFITGHVIALPLLIGAGSKIFIVDPLNTLFFPLISASDFMFKFCTGMIVAGALQSFLDLPSMIKSALKNVGQKGLRSNIRDSLRKVISLAEISVLALIIIGFLTYFKFSLLEQIYLLVATFICAYQIAVIAGKIGMAQLGRFATFAMLPALFMFGINYVKLTLIATFVEISGGVATDVLFGRKMGQLASIPRQRLRLYQLFGLLICACSIGIIFWLLISHFGIGSEELFAQRSRARALMLDVGGNFDLIVLLIGGFFGLLLKQLHMSPMLVLGGLLMPLNWSLGLIMGGLLTYLVSDREAWEPFGSGVFAANSIWELCKTLF